MKAILVAILSFASINAFGFENKTYSCKNSNPDLPDSTYTISTLSVDGVALPYLQASRFHKNAQTNLAEEITVKGIASVSTIGSSEILSINQFRLEFINGELVNCKQ